MESCGHVFKATGLARPGAKMWHVLSTHNVNYGSTHRGNVSSRSPSPLLVPGTLLALACRTLGETATLPL